MKRKTIVAVLAFVGFMLVVNAQGAPPSKSDVSPYVDQLFTAIRQGDKDALYFLTEQAQNELTAIKVSKPEFLREKKQTEHREAWLKALADPQGGAPAEYFQLGQLLDLAPSVNILEVYETNDVCDIYICLRFNSTETSPLLLPAMSGLGAAIGGQSNARLVKERTFKLKLTKARRYLGCDSVPEVPDVDWTNVPIQIVAVGVQRWMAGMTCLTIGDSPLKGATVLIGGYPLDASDIRISQGEHAVVVRFQSMFKQVPTMKTGDTPVSIEIIDTRGQAAKAYLVVPAFTESFSREDIYVREPWRVTKLWKTRPGIRLLQNGDQSNPQQNQKPTIEKVPQPPTGSSKPSPQSSAKHDLTDVVIGNSMISLFGDVSISVSIDGQTPVIFKSDEFSDFEMEIGSRHTVTAVFRGKTSVKKFVVKGPGTKIKFQPPDFQ